VLLSGQVGDGLDVVLLHADGLRTSYSLLASIAGARGDVVKAGDVVGTSGSQFHFGVRAGTAYLDPAVLLADPTPTHAYVPLTSLGIGVFGP